MAYDHSGLVDRVKEYKNKAKVLRQIHSNKLRSTERRAMLLDYGTFAASLFLTFFSVVGVQQLHGMFFSTHNVKTVEFAFNVIVVAVLVFSFLQIALRLGEKKVDFLNAVKALTHFITDLDDILAQQNLSPDDCKALIERLNDKYESLTGILPSSSDDDWREAKQDLAEKSKP